MDYLQRISKELDLPPTEKQQALEELRAHFQDIRDDLISKGASVSDAEKEAAEKLGNPESIAAGLGAVHLRDGWKTTLLSVLPFLTAIPVLMMRWGIRVDMQYPPDMLFDFNRPLVLAGGALLICSGIAMLVVGTRELLRDKRPTWLAPVLAVAILWPFGFLLNVDAPFALSTSHFESDNNYLHYGSPFRAVILLSFFCWVMMASGLLIACARIRARKWIPLAIGAVFAAPMIVLVLENEVPVVEHTPIFLLAVLGLTAFARHPHSTASRASLFVFACYSFPMLLQPTLPAAIAASIAVAGVLAYSRAADKKTKYAVLICVTAAMTGVSWGFVSEADPWPLRLWADMGARILVALLVLIPVAFEFGRGSTRGTLIAG